MQSFAQVVTRPTCSDAHTDTDTEQAAGMTVKLSSGSRLDLPREVRQAICKPSRECGTLAFEILPLADSA
jgi:hypothetical protein